MSAAPDLRLLAELRAAGFDVRRRDRGRLTVTPGENLTASQRARIVTGKSELLAALEAESLLWSDLDQRLRQMANRWQYSAEDLVEALTAARSNLAGWLLAVDADEQAAGLCQRGG